MVPVVYDRNPGWRKQLHLIYPNHVVHNIIRKGVRIPIVMTCRLSCVGEEISLEVFQ